MLELAVLGKPEFTLGFQLAGIKQVIEVDGEAVGKIRNLMESQEIGIVVLDQDAFNQLDDFDRTAVEDSIRPVFVVLSEEESDRNLQRMIKKSIGVDIWEK